MTFPLSVLLSLSLSLSLSLPLYPRQLIKVCVIYRGERLVDLCAGTQGPLDPRPVRPSTLFCVFSAGKALCSTAVHLLADRGLLTYDQPLSDLWPEFARNGKEATTVRGEERRGEEGGQNPTIAQPAFGVCGGRMEKGKNINTCSLMYAYNL